MRLKNIIGKIKCFFGDHDTTKAELISGYYANYAICQCSRCKKVFTHLMPKYDFDLEDLKKEFFEYIDPIKLKKLVFQWAEKLGFPDPIEMAINKRHCRCIYPKIEVDEISEKSIWDKIHELSHKFKREYIRPPTILFLGREAYFELLDDVRIITNYQHGVFTELTSFLKMKVKVLEDNTKEIIVGLCMKEDD